MLLVSSTRNTAQLLSYWINHTRITIFECIRSEGWRSSGFNWKYFIQLAWRFLCHIPIWSDLNWTSFHFLLHRKWLEFFGCNIWIHVIWLISFTLVSLSLIFGRNFSNFSLNHRDLQPNIGLFWYFFTEMFEHFRPLFLFSFQMNATILYLVPLTIKLHKQPIFLSTILIALTSIFRSYPCVGDIAFYMALFPLWKHSTKREYYFTFCVIYFSAQRCRNGVKLAQFHSFSILSFSVMANYFVVFCFFLITSALGPTVWYLWIYCNSANANFYFGATLAFASAQVNEQYNGNMTENEKNSLLSSHKKSLLFHHKTDIMTHHSNQLDSFQIFLVTDLLFASNKRDFCLRHGLNRLNQLVLE